VSKEEAPPIGRATSWGEGRLGRHLICLIGFDARQLVEDDLAAPFRKRWSEHHWLKLHGIIALAAAWEPSTRHQRYFMRQAMRPMVDSIDSALGYFLTGSIRGFAVKSELPCGGGTNEFVG
jgi:hypothetical protein